jgi:hypothetical protein
MLILSVIAVLQASAMPAAAASPASQLESVYDFHHDADGVTVRVRSNGCTQASSFTVTTAHKAGATVLSLQRSRPDYCRALLRDGVALKWAWAELRIAPPDRLIVANPLAAR